MFEAAFRSRYELRRPPRGPENRAAVIHVALAMFDRPEIAADLARRVPNLGGYVATVDLVPGMGICVAKTGAPAHWSVWGRPAQLATCVTDVANIGATSTLGRIAMTYSIFDTSGNLVDAFKDGGAALDCLAGIAEAEPESASDVFLVTQDDEGTIVGETVYASSVSIPA